MQMYTLDMEDANQSDIQLRILVEKWQVLVGNDSLSNRNKAALIAHSIMDDRYDAWRMKHPSYEYATDIAAKLELPDNLSGNVDELWRLLLSVIAVLDQSVERTHSHGDTDRHQ